MRDQDQKKGPTDSHDIPMSRDGREDDAVRVLIVDDHDLFRTGLASLLECQAGIEVVAQASGGRMGMRLAMELQPDVVLMDLRMPDLEGTDATRQILAEHPDMRVLVLTVASGNDDVDAALEAGACGFVAKDTPIDGVAVAVRAAAQGVAWLSLAQPSWCSDASELSPRSRSRDQTRSSSSRAGSWTS